MSDHNDSGAAFFTGKVILHYERRKVVTIFQLRHQKTTKIITTTKKIFLKPIKI